MPSLTASISLALAAKLKLLFETSPDKFLSFPTGLAYPTRFFGFMTEAGSGLSLQERQAFLIEFARLTNGLPGDTAVFAPPADRLLWDVYSRALTDSVFADSTLTPEQERQLTEAIDFLTDEQTVDGTPLRVPSAAVRTYYEYKTVYDDLNRQYLNEKLTVQFAPDDAEGRRLREAWTTAGERDCLERIKRAENDWISLGFRAAVEEQQHVQRTLEPKRAPEVFGRTCLADLELAQLDDLNANGLPGGYATFFSPNDVFNPATPWPSLTLSKGELLRLAAQAPPELTTRFGGGATDEGIERLSFEYNRVVTVRPWLNAGFLSARSWTLPGGTVLSDGKLPRAGTLPAYVTSLVVVRNIRVYRRPDVAPTGPLIIPIISKERLAKFRARYESPPIIPKQPVEVMLHAEASAAVPTVRDHRNADHRGAGHRQRYLQTAYRGATIRVPIRPPAKDGPAPTTPTRPPVPVGGGRPGPRPMPAQPPLTEEKFDFDGVVILAFECTRLPKSPDPDPALSWSVPIP